VINGGLHLGGKVVVITGASAGMGAGFAKAVASAGGTPVLAARRIDRLEKLAAEIGGDCMPVVCDVVEAADRDRLLAAVLERFGRIDGLVNNAGAEDIRPALRQSTEDFARLLDVNLAAPFALARDAATAMREAGGGSIVNIASVAGIIPVGWVPHASYVAAKTALVGLTRELASQWGRYGIRVNAIAPGAFDTEMTPDGGSDSEQLRQGIPLGRTGRPGDMDALLLLLLGPNGAYITGQTIAVDGGLSAAL
jgi:NAD(P)-dependent dehydrogenase (short-subunit alcohol dehydrogenase family)